MTTLHMMFDRGENIKSSVEWELLDTPPAREWADIYMKSRNEDKITALNLTDVISVPSKEFMEKTWLEIRASLQLFGNRNSKYPFVKLNSKIINDIISDLMNASSSGRLSKLTDFSSVNNLLAKLKSLSFYIHEIKDDDGIKGYEKASFGYISYQPDPLLAAPFPKEWDQYLTFDIEPGTVYAGLSYPNSSWLEMLIEPRIETVIENIRSQQYSRPSNISNTCFIPFYPDITRKKADFILFLYENEKRIKSVIPDFNPVTILKETGRIPVAKYNPSITSKSMLTLKELSEITNVFKIEFYESEY